MVKKILFNIPSSNLHAIWKDLIKNPPEGYRFVVEKNKIDLHKINTLKKNKIINFVYKNLLRKIISPLQLSEKFVNIPKNVDFAYSPNVMMTKKFPWVCDLEEAICLAGNNRTLLKKRKKEIERTLSSKYCKKIMPFTEFGKKNIEKEFNVSSFKDKIEVVHFASDIPKIETKKDSKFVNMIFVGTSHQTDPKIFNLKGGREAIAAFKILSKKYQNIKLTIFSNIPKDIDTNIDRLQICSLISRDKLLKIYAKSDIFLAPNYFGLGMTFVEAMGSGLPIIGTDMFGLPDAVDKNGFLINVRKKGKYEHGGPSSNDFTNFAEFIYKNNSQSMVNQIVEYISILMENPSLRTKMGEESRKKYEKEFSIEARNKKLKKIFDGISF
ncbi:glycosyltransferase [Candidatus Pacearchaeota archaeon]|nr:glycosyltransferase [Candidatus Pacearchaeota archaeon]